MRGRCRCYFCWDPLPLPLPEHLRGGPQVLHLAEANRHWLLIAGELESDVKNSGGTIDAPPQKKHCMHCSIVPFLHCCVSLDFLSWAMWWGNVDVHRCAHIET